MVAGGIDVGMKWLQNIAWDIDTYIYVCVSMC